MATIAEQLATVSQLGLLEGIKAGLLQGTGEVTPGAAVADLAAQTVTDIATAQTAVNNIVAKVNALLASLRAADLLAS